MPPTFEHKGLTSGEPLGWTCPPTDMPAALAVEIVAASHSRFAREALSTRREGVVTVSDCGDVVATTKPPLLVTARQFAATLISRVMR